ncbi:terminase small subunit [Flavobacterium sp. CBA20B-1]|uniref:terminase small subunit n=1 Tax=unclassified Flavobacterium TaxID=196869 RepID=UPI002225076C|nr:MULTISPECIES: terminase small subunit [unclassified Flavobacterium]WCM42391.1 terminase small subunit [Flavobacterium sp. CBA20B-1]
MSNKPLTVKQEAFCQAYMRLGDKSAAYREVYSCSKMKPETIHERASRLSKEYKVNARIDELQSKAREIAEKEFQITHKEILNHLNILRKARIDDYVVLEYRESTELDDDGFPRTSSYPVLKFKPFDELTEEQLMCIESIKEGKYGLELKLHGIDWSIEKICKHLGFYEKDNKQKAINIFKQEDRQSRLEQLKSKLKG